MTLEQVIERFTMFPKYMGHGAGKMSKRFKCSRVDIYNARKIVRLQKKKKGAKILLFDIESSPSIVFSFNRFNTNIYIDQVIKDPIMLTWSAKWLFSEDVMSDRITSKEVLSFNDYRIVKSLWNMVNEADIVIAHYGDKFDIPMLNARAVINNIKPFSFTESIDTKRVSSKHFRFPSNKLDALATYLGVDNKIKTDFSLWKRCMNGEEKALEEMNTYCDQDVRTLEDVYLKLRPYIKSHPNLGLYMDSLDSVCANCGSSNLEEEKSYYTRTSKFKVFRCECGAMNRVRQNSFPKESRPNLIVSNAK
jgi:DNA polymerase elongation subunit (family B)